MTRWILLPLVVLGVAGAAAFAAPTAAPPGPPLPAPVRLDLPEKHATGRTKCALCHTPDGWDDARAFAHERTGFPLRGAHTRATCRACHPQDFNTPVQADCASCHRDPHAGSFGALCASCHDEKGWATSFSADAHRRTNFPLVGRHALMPCQECHLDARERRFARPAVACIGCHQADVQRTALGALDHARLGFGNDCRSCHDAWRWEGARFAAHDRCFQITGGEHAGLRCASCHTSVPTEPVSGACATNTASCTKCHEHSCASSDRRHGDVPGYQCKDRKCYECHRFSVE